MTDIEQFLLFSLIVEAVIIAAMYWEVKYNSAKLSQGARYRHIALLVQKNHEGKWTIEDIDRAGDTLRELSIKSKLTLEQLDCLRDGLCELIAECKKGE